MDRQLFERWFEKVFIPNCGRARPVVLFSDNQSSRDSPRVAKLANEQQVACKTLKYVLTSYAYIIKRTCY